MAHQGRDATLHAMAPYSIRVVGDPVLRQRAGEVSDIDGRLAKLAEEGRPLAPKKRPGSKPKMDEQARRLLEADVQERPVATLSDRREFLRTAAGVSVSDSTVSRMLRRLQFSRKKDRWERESATNS